MIMKLMIRIPGPLIVFAIFLIVPYYIDLYDISKSGAVNFNTPALALFGVGMLIYFVATILGLASINEFIGLYLKSEDPETITVKDVYAKVKAQFWEYVGGYFLLILIVTVGFFLFFIPGMYLGIALMLTFSVITIEKAGVIESLSRSYKLISGNWWASFGFMIVISILTVFITYIFAIPVGMTAGFFMLQSDMGWVASFLYALINSLTFVITFFSSVIYFIAINIKYFSLVEQKEQVGLKEQIEEMNLVQDPVK